MAVNNEPQLIAGKDSSGNLVPVKVNSDGSLVGVSGGGGGGTVGGATAAKQDEQTALLNSLEAKTQQIQGNFLSTSNLISGGIANINSNFGNKFETPATNDTGFFSFIQLFKRLLLKITEIIDLLKVAATLDIQSLNLTNANTEYSFAFTNVKEYSFKPQGGDIRYAVLTGKVATSVLPYYTLSNGSEEVQDFGTGRFTGTIYFASSTANVNVLIKIEA